MTLRLNLTFADNEVKSGQYRVRLYANFKDGNQLNSNTANDFELRKTQDSIASQYLTYLLNKDYNLSWQILANEVKAEITYEDYTKMAEITTEILLTRLNEIDLFISGITTTLSGRKYVYYTYKFNLGNPITPEYIINISFSDIEKNKIIRIHSPVLIMEFK